MRYDYMRCIFWVVRSNLDFENKAARDRNWVDFTSAWSRIKQGSRISLAFGKFGVMFIRQFLWKQTWQLSPSFADIWYAILNVVSVILRSPNKRLAQHFKVGELKMKYKWHGFATKLVSTCRSMFNFGILLSRSSPIHTHTHTHYIYIYTW